jgi:hypothetical protein
MDIDFDRYDIQFKSKILENDIIYVYKKGNQILIDVINTGRDEMINLYRNGYDDLFDIVEKVI